jgi:Rieske 2Fe-2S family protein
MNSIKQLIKQQPEDWSLRQEFYKQVDIYELEIKKIYMDSWLFIGHDSEIPNKGDYFVYNLLSESVIVVRGKDHQIHGYMNVCRHRGSRICLENRGNMKRFTCPYHAWTYNLDGSLMTAKELGNGVRKEDLGLHKCQIAVVEGLILLNFSDQPSSLNGLKDELSEPMKMFGFKDLKIAAHKNYPIDANWKLAVENYNECYHCAPAHPEYSQSHSQMLADEKKYDQAQQIMLDSLSACGMKNIEIDASYTNQIAGQEQYAYWRYALFDGYATGSKNGEPIAPLMGDIKQFNTGASDFNIGPVSFLLAYCDHVVGYAFTPTTHETCQCDVYWMVRGDAVEGEDYDVKNLTWLWDVTTKADERIVMNNQKGVNSRKYQPGPFTKKESSEKSFIRWYLALMQD